MNAYINIGTISEVLGRTTECKVWNNFINSLVTPYAPIPLNDVKKILTSNGANIIVCADNNVVLNFITENHKLMFTLQWS